MSVRCEIDTPLVARGTKLRVLSDGISRSFVPLELKTSGRGVIKGSAAGIYDEREAESGHTLLLALHCRILGQEVQWYLRPETDRCYTVYRVNNLG
jgi:hypothetical protein